MPELVTRTELESLLAQVAALREQLEALIARYRAEERASAAGLGAPARMRRLI